jgi:hypothetical protein
MGQEFFRALQGPDAAPGADRLAPFDQFIGAWDVDVVWFENGTLVRSEKGEWHFASILGGRAMQDVWIVPSRDMSEHESSLYEYGTSLRFPDPTGRFWRSTWHGPVNGVVISFIAKQVRDDIVLEGRHPDGRSLRWVFSQITRNRFLWQNFASADDGEAWQLIQEFVATRQNQTGGVISTH